MVTPDNALLQSRAWSGCTPDDLSRRTQELDGRVAICIERGPVSNVTLFIRELNSNWIASNRTYGADPDNLRAVGVIDAHSAIPRIRWLAYSGAACAQGHTSRLAIRTQDVQNSATGRSHVRADAFEAGGRDHCETLGGRTRDLCVDEPGSASVKTSAQTAVEIADEAITVNTNDERIGLPFSSDKSAACTRPCTS